MCFTLEEKNSKNKITIYLFVCFIFQTIFNFPLQQAFVEHWENFVDITHYNKNISSVKIIADLSSNTDIVYVNTSSMFDTFW